MGIYNNRMPRISSIIIGDFDKTFLKTVSILKFNIIKF